MIVMIIMIYYDDYTVDIFSLAFLKKVCYSNPELKKK